MKEEGIIRKINKSNDKAILFTVKKGYKQLRECKIKGMKKRAILFDNEPLITFSEEKSPMCSIDIKIVEGRVGINKDTMDKININTRVENMEDVFNKLNLFFEILEDGKYEMRELKMMPTDVEISYFYKARKKDFYYNRHSDLYYRRRYLRGCTKFLVPSEGPECFDEERVNYYRKKILEGEELLGVGIDLTESIVLLLDGHHKAIASYLEGKVLKCITVKCIDRYEKIEEISQEKIYNYNYPNQIKSNFDLQKRFFPNFLAINFIDRNIDTSRQRIERIFKFQCNNPFEEIDEILNYLSLYNKEKAKKICFEILKKNDFQVMWDKCIDYLSKYNEDRVRKLFSDIKNDFAIKNSIGYEQNIVKINEYLS